MSLTPSIPSILASTVAVTLMAFAPPATAATNIACVGDSITFGFGLAAPDVESYPAVLQTILGSDEYSVRNFGVSSTTLMKSGDFPYWSTAELDASAAFGPNIVVLMLGTNDSKDHNWAHSSDFVSDYVELVEYYESQGAQVYAALPPPVHDAGIYEIRPTSLNDEIVPLIRSTAETLSLPIIDIFSALSERPELFPDTVHPNAAGCGLIAETVKTALLGSNEDPLETSGSGGGEMAEVMSGGAPSGGGPAIGGEHSMGGIQTGGALVGGAQAEVSGVGGRDTSSTPTGGSSSLEPIPAAAGGASSQNHLIGGSSGSELEQAADGPPRDSASTAGCSLSPGARLPASGTLLASLLSILLWIARQKPSATRSEHSRLHG